MSGQAKWTMVGGGKKGGQSATVKETNSKKIGGLQESTGAFTLYSNMNGEEEQEPTKPTTRSSKERPPSGKSVTSTEGASKKKLTTKKTKTQTQKHNFDEYVRELDPNTLHIFTKDARKKYPDNPQNLLKEITGHVQLLFGEVEVERDFAFTNRTPGYPITTLSSPCQKPLLSAINSCPLLAQEAVFRYCLDQLLNEIRGGIPSYGTRIMLQLFIECNPSTCTECTQRIKILLQSSLNKVPEALSLLWVGLPHPQIHPAPALEAWPELCLPLLYSTPNVPRQVLNFAVDYTCILLKQLGREGGHSLLPLLPPSTLCALLASPLLTSRRTQTNVQEMINLLQVTLLESCSDEEVAKYFTAVFKRLTEDKVSQAAVTFAMECLSRSSSSVKIWSKLFLSLPFSSQYLLKELASKERLSPDLPLHELSVTLRQIVSRGSPEEKTLAQGLLTRHASSFRAVKKRTGGVRGNQTETEREGSWCSVCCVLLVMLSVVYLYFLSLLLIHLAKKGPTDILDSIQQYIPLKDYSVTKLIGVMWKALTMFVQFLDELKEKLL